MSDSSVPLSVAVKAYMAALARHWVAVMGGAIFGVVLPVVEKISKRELPTTVFAVIAVGCGVLIATFKAWHEEYEKALGAKLRAEMVQAAASTFRVSFEFLRIHLVHMSPDGTVEWT